MGTINGLIFFCNIMSINESLFFDQSKLSFVRIFVSLINLDLGFEMCFYREMSETAKTGLQFVFPLYLWLLMFIIIMIGKHYMRSRKSTHSAVPVLATLILLSYSKILRATISVFSSVTVHYSTKDSNFSRSQQFVAWQPDPNILYLEDKHIGLFLVALVFTVLFILPLAFTLTFPKVVLRSKKLSYFFPLLDCACLCTIQKPVSLLVWSTHNCTDIFIWNGVFYFHIKTHYYCQEWWLFYCLLLYKLTFIHSKIQ